MAPSPPGEVTRLLQSAREGDDGAQQQLFPLIYEDLRQLASGLLRGERTGHTLQATALVHEAWLRLSKSESPGSEHRLQFLALAATTMRHVLVDHARRRGRDKRGGGVPAEPLDETVAVLEQSCGDLLALDSALESLGALDARKARLVELRFFAGLSMREASEALAISLRQAEREWTTVRAFLRQRLSPALDGG